MNGNRGTTMNKIYCPRCGVADCIDPDSKQCSDNCLSQTQIERNELRAQLISVSGLEALANHRLEVIKEALKDWKAGNLTGHSTLIVIDSLINPAPPSQEHINLAAQAVSQLKKLGF